jgi:helicase SWR1
MAAANETPVKKDVSKTTPVKASVAKTTPARKRESTRISAKSYQQELDRTRKEIERAEKKYERMRKAQAIEALHEDESDDESGTDSESSAAESIDLSNFHPPTLLKKVTFRIRPPVPHVATPAHIPQARQYASFGDFLQYHKLEEPGTRQPLTLQQIRQEAARRRKVQNAPHIDRLFAASEATVEEKDPHKQYAHLDHLLAHITHFQNLMHKEQLKHQRYAQMLAHEAKRYVEAKEAKGRVKSPEEIEKELVALWRGRFKVVTRDVVRLWQAVEAEVNSVRLKEYEAQQEEKRKEHLNRVLDRTEAKLRRQDSTRFEHDSSMIGSHDEIGDSDVSDSGDESSNSGQMSASGSDSDTSEDFGVDADADMTLDELKAKYENLPEEEICTLGDNPAHPSETGEEDDSDHETEMDSELDTDEDADDEEDDDEENASDTENDSHLSNDGSPGGLLSLFSKEEIAEMAPIDAGEESKTEIGADVAKIENELLTGYLQTDSDINMVDAEADQMAARPMATLPMPEKETFENSKSHSVGDNKHTIFSEAGNDALVDDAGEVDSSRDQSDRTSPATSASKVAEVESVSSVDQHHDPMQMYQNDKAVKEEPASRYSTPIPPLLRGNLRDYQHEGLDWLANLYANGRSGILADEMGLGKTIQSISLLAHLATTYEVWGPHLIVVPTSVMLNWEMEFKKFLPGFKILTYYGDIEERKAKRRGWMADDAFNVVITSYQLVLKDASSFKRRRWHYMILDEAHNIKNFRSERWQTMMTFNTRARLLLTGTPLQNNLTELWSLLFFLHYGQENEGEDDAFAGLKDFQEWFRKPVDSILEQNKQVLDQEDQEQIAKLHKVIRPYLLRRLKRDVEKQMPAKYEHVEFCRLSKRQRQLYDGFMSRAQTKETLASGNYLSIINALMQLRKVCNHPDLFETRPINTSFAMPRSVAAQFEIKDLLVRRQLFGQDPYDRTDLDFLELVPVSREHMSKLQSMELSRWNAYQPLKELRERQWIRVRRRSKIFAATDRKAVMDSLENVARETRLRLIERTMYYDAFKHHQHPVFGSQLFDRLNFPLKHKVLSETALQGSKHRFWETEPVFTSIQLVRSLETRAQNMQPFVEKYGCVTPAAVAIDLPVTLIGEHNEKTIRQTQSVQRYDPFHEAQMKLSIAFPDKRLLQYDCGKLQRLDKLLRQLQTDGHRALIFTQMTRVLDLLEQFLNIHGHRYLRLDGSTKVEQRQALTDRFNNDTRILCFILSSRSGGLGINLTGADTVIFYDLDWNPAMDRQCTDRAHRIGQTRDVHIYRFVSEHTIESNILRKANQKQLLDDVVIQEGDFTTDHFNKVSYKDMLDDAAGEDDVAGAAMDRVLGGDMTQGKGKSVFEQAEDRDDVAAARVAEKEVQNADDADFDESLTAAQMEKQDDVDPYSATDAAMQEAEGGIKHIDEYMLRLQQHLLRDVPLVIKDKNRSKKGKSRRARDEGRRR